MFGVNVVLTIMAFLSVHDGDIIAMIAALNPFPSEEHLPVTHRQEPRQWRTSQYVPMNGHIIFEHIACKSSSATTATTGTAEQQEAPLKRFVRFRVNDSSGPWSSRPLEDFLAFVQKRGKAVGDFREVCGLEDDAPERITFLHQ